jgi:hypothetical protein
MKLLILRSFFNVKRSPIPAKGTTFGKKIICPFAADHGAQNRDMWRHLVRVTAANVQLKCQRLKSLFQMSTIEKSI